MALKNENENYLKIINVKQNVNKKHGTISYMIWKDKEIRENPGDFDKPKEKVIKISDNLLNNTPDITKTIKDNLLTLGYEYLKQNGFSDWVDC